MMYLPITLAVLVLNIPAGHHPKKGRGGAIEPGV